MSFAKIRHDGMYASSVIKTIGMYIAIYAERDDVKSEQDSPVYLKSLEVVPWQNL